MIFVLIGFFELALMAVLFGGAGRVDLPWFWGLIGAHGVLMCIGASVMDPGLLRERLRKNNPGIDRRLCIALSVGVLVHLGGAGVDVRVGWSQGRPAAGGGGGGLVVSVAGGGGLLLGGRGKPVFSR